MTDKLQPSNWSRTIIPVGDSTINYRLERTIHPDGSLEHLIKANDEILKNVKYQLDMDEEASIHTWLIQMGWTPPARFNRKKETKP